MEKTICQAGTNLTSATSFTVSCRPGTRRNQRACLAVGLRKVRCADRLRRDPIPQGQETVRRESGRAEQSGIPEQASAGLSGDHTVSFSEPLSRRSGDGRTWLRLPPSVGSAGSLAGLAAPQQTGFPSRLSDSPQLARQSPPPQIAGMSGRTHRFLPGDPKDSSNKSTQPTVLLYEHTEDR